MEIIKRINNNVALVSENRKQMIVMGSGVGFKAYPGDTVDKSKVENTYILEKNMDLQNMIKVLEIIPTSIIEVSKKVIDLSEGRLKKKLSPNLIVTLSDHLYYALKRQKPGDILKNPLEWEIKAFYPDEYQLATEAIQLINRTLESHLPNDEAAFIAMHFVNGQIEVSDEGIAAEMISIIRHILNIVQYHFHIKIDENSTLFFRFATHLRYYLIRQLQSEKDVTLLDSNLFEVISTTYKKAYECAVKIASYLEKNYHFKSSENEKVYLSLHINRLVTENLRGDNNE
ncbi:PRD domain-containing protein [Listeria kieliensis]